MNRIFRLIWNAHLAMYVPAPECGRGRGKGSGCRRAVGAVVLSMLALPAYALPAGGEVSAGQGSIGQSGSAMTVTQQSSNLAINWQSFGIGAAESVTFAQPSASAIALNRVLGADPSRIHGQLSANGQVWLLNPNGVLFGGGAQVNVGGLVASTLNLSDSDFLSGKRTFAGTGGFVTNQGTISAADGGYIALLGGKVSNEGVIQARLGTVALGAGNQITLDFAGDKLLNLQVDQAALDAMVQNKQLIQADGGMVLLSTRAANDLLETVVNNTGVIEARTIDTHTGTIKLLGGMQAGSVRVAGTLDASAPNGGDGGFIETSGANVKLGDAVHVTTAAPGGNTGQWSIAESGDIVITPGSGGISGATLASQLATTNVTLLAQGDSGNGDVRVNGEIGWNSANSLTVSAYGDLKVAKTISNSGTGDINLRADNAGACVSGAQSCATISFMREGSISVNGGGVNLYYNPAGSNNPADANGNGPSYASPTDYSKYVSLAGGSTLNAWMLVNDVNQLQAMNTNLAGTFALGRDIDASATAGWNAGAGFVPVGSESTGFGGDFDGSDHTITALTVNRPLSDSVGLFGRSDGQVSNVALVDGVVNGHVNTGALAGYNTGTILNSRSSSAIKGSYSLGGLVGLNDGAVVSSDSAGSVDSGGLNIGGLIGTNTGTVTNAHSSVDLYSGFTTTHYVGGLIGYNSGAVANSYFDGAIIGHASPTGGLIGYNSGTVTNSYSTGAVQGYSGTGGLVGYNDGTVAHSYSTGEVRGGLNAVGGLIARNGVGATVDNSYSTSAVSGGNYVGGLIGENKGNLSNSYSTGSASGGSFNAIGGLVGSNSGTVHNTFSTGNAIGSGQVGGLIGYNTGTVSESYSTGSAGGFIAVGGLVGSNLGSLSNTYSTGAVQGMGELGGLVGSNTGTVGTSYSTGAVSGVGGPQSFDLGGLAGKNTGTVTSSYWDITTSGQSTSAGGTGLTTAQMLQQASFAGFDFSNTWWMSEGNTRPFLRAEYSTMIGNAHQLQLVDLDGSASYTLARDIDMSELANPSGMWDTAKGFVPLGSSAIQPFAGSFDGKGHTITGLTIHGGNSSTVGYALFAQNDGQVRNLGVVEAVVTGSDGVAALVGRNHGLVSNSHSSGSFNAFSYAGGLVAFNDGGTVNNSSSSGSVTGYSQLGGLVGGNSGTVSSSHSTATASGSADVGGLVGLNMPTGTISTSSSTGDVTQPGTGLWVQNVGGLVGNNEGTINSSSSSGTVSGYQLVGGLVGLNRGIVMYSSSDGAVNGSYLLVGGLIGSNDNRAGFGIVSDSHSTGAVNGYEYVGGLAGWSNGIVSGSFSTGSVNGALWDTGGLVGFNQGSVSRSFSSSNVTGVNGVGGLIGSNEGTVNNSYSTGNVDGGRGVGGLAGYNWGTVSTSYSTGGVSGSQNVGGLVGSSPTGIVASSYWDITTSGQSTSAGGTGLTDAQMKQQASFTGFDFVNIWDINEGVSYPFLRTD